MHILYKNSLSEVEALEQLADSLDQFEKRIRYHSRSNPRLGPALDCFASGLDSLFDKYLSPELLRCRATILEHEDKMAEHAERFAPEFVRRAIALRRAFEAEGDNDA